MNAICRFIRFLDQFDMPIRLLILAIYVFFAGASFYAGFRLGCGDVHCFEGIMKGQLVIMAGMFIVILINDLRKK